ncbi:CoA ester lyase [Cereibacter sp. SYSU M97828]|nr:CoA ester lyase [Cereibacter flavus]
MREQPVWRSLLFVPVNVPRFVAKAADCGADAIILDLEDSIALSQKNAARDAIPAAAAALSGQGPEVGVRINRPLRDAVRDIEAAVRPGVTFLAIPKVADASHLLLLCEVIDAVESERGMQHGTTKLIAMIEDPIGYRHMHDISRSSDRLVAMSLGTEDFASEMGMEPTLATLTQPKQNMAIAARAGGLAPLGIVGPTTHLSDTEGFRTAAELSATFGFVGSFAVHPSQVPILNAAFSPTATALARAIAVAEAADRAAEQGLGAVSLDGKMIDRPVVERARSLIGRAARIAGMSKGDFQQKPSEPSAASVRL